MITLLTICAVVAGMAVVGIIVAMIIDFARHGCDPLR